MRNNPFIFYLLLTIVPTLFMPVEVFSQENAAEGRYEAIFRSVARPRLISPGNQVIDLSGKETLRFQWGLATGALVALDYIEFYVYKGEAISDKNLVFVKRMANNEYSIEINSTLFENGQSYVWGIKQFFLSAKESNERFIIFKVNK
jgi:hypothetical protein